MTGTIRRDSSVSEDEPGVRDGERRGGVEHMIALRQALTGVGRDGE